MKKKLMTLVITAAMAALMCVPAFADEAADVNANAWLGMFNDDGSFDFTGWEWLFGNGGAAAAADTAASSLYNVAPSATQNCTIVSNVTTIEGEVWPEAVCLEFKEDEPGFIQFINGGQYTTVTFELAAPAEIWPNSTYCFFEIYGDENEQGQRTMTMFIDGMSQKYPITYSDYADIGDMNVVTFAVYPEFDSDLGGYVYLKDIVFQ